VEEAAMKAAAEAVEGNKDKQEYNVAMVTAANNNSNSNSSSGGDDDNGSSDSDGSKKNNNQLTATSCSGRSSDYISGRGTKKLIWPTIFLARVGAPDQCLRPWFTK
jgi:hypothetical protein